MPKSSKQVLLESIWDEIARVETIRNDRKINAFSTSHDHTAQDIRSSFIWEDTFTDPDSYDDDQRYVVTRWAQLSYDYKIIDHNPTIETIAGWKFWEIRKIVHTYRPTVVERTEGEAEKIQNKLFTGSHTKLWEESLTRYLLAEGFLVALEPDLYIPEQEHGPRRTPDLMVVHKGRVIMIEIDSKYHLIKESDNPPKRWEANIRKYKRDRAFDRYMLCNGIPVLRIWFEEVRDKPEEIMSQILQIYDSIGGDRFTYR